MAKSYAGYAERDQRGAPLDIGGAIRTEAQKISKASAAVDTERDKLLSDYEKSKKEIENIGKGKSKGFQNWIQEQITNVTTRMYDDFKMLQKGKGRNANEYRRVKQNMMSSWKMLAKRANDWNKHYETALNTVAEGKGSPFMGDMLGETAKIGDFVDLNTVIDEDGNMRLEGIDEGGNLYTTDLTSILAPENSYDEALDSAAALNKMMKDLPPTKVDLGNGKFREDQSLHPAFNKQRLINNQAALANSRSKSKWYSALFDNKVKNVWTQSQINKNVVDYLASDIGQMAVNQLAISDAFKQKHPTLANNPKALEAKAIEEIRGEQYMLNVFASKNNNNINEPNFDHTFIVPKGKPMTITYDRIDASTGEIITETETYMPGEEVPIGDRQDKRIKSALYKAQGAMVDYKESGGKKSQLTPGQIADEKERLRKQGQRLDTSVNYYETGRDFSRGINLDKLINDGKVKNIELVEDHIHSKTQKEGPHMVIETKEGVLVELPYEVDEKGEITEEGYDKMNANLQQYIQNEKNMGIAKSRFEEGKKESQRILKEGGTSYTPGKGTVGRRTRYVPIKNLGDDDKFYENPKTDKKPKWVLKKKLDKILKDTDGKSIDELKGLLTDLSSEKKSSIMSDLEITRTEELGKEPMTVKIGNKSWTIEIDTDNNLSTRRAELKTKIDEILEAFHNQPKKTKISFQKWLKANPKGTYPDYLESIK